MTGFAMTGLGHSQYRWTALAQIADLAGIGGVSAVMVLVAAALARMLPWRGAQNRLVAAVARGARAGTVPGLWPLAAGSAADPARARKWR